MAVIRILGGILVGVGIAQGVGGQWWSGVVLVGVGIVLTTIGYCRMWAEERGMNLEIEKLLEEMYVQDRK